MDPLSITASVVGISAACASVITTLKNVHDKYKQADLTVLAICSESSTVQAALAQVEYLLKQDGDAVVSRFQQQPVLASAFDTSITGCQMVYSCLDAELRELATALQQDGGLDRKRRFKTAWKQDTMLGFQQQIRGQVLALNTLLQGLQMESLGEMRRLLQSQQAQLDQINDNTASLRKQYPQSTVPDSIFDNSRSADSIFGAADSVLGAEDFAFDDAIVNSKAYRRAMALAQAQFDNAHRRDEPTAPVADTADSISSTGQVVDDDPEMTTSIAPEPAGLAWQAPSKYRKFITSTTPLDESLPRLSEDWASAFELKRADIDGRGRKELECQNILWEILQTEHLFITNLAIIGRLYVDPILNSWPQLVSKPSVFADRVFAHLAELREAHERHLYLPMLANWERNGAWATFDPEPFLDLIKAAEGTYVLFSRNYEYAQVSIRDEIERNHNFRAFIDSRRQHPWSQKLGWDNYLKAPITRLQRLRLLLAVLGKTTLHNDTKVATVRADSKLILLVTMCEDGVQEGQRRFQINALMDVLSAAEAARINLASPERRYIRTGAYPAQIPGLTESKTWKECIVTLLDNGLVITISASVVDSMDRKYEVVICEPLDRIHTSFIESSFKFRLFAGSRSTSLSSAKTLYPLRIEAIVQIGCKLWKVVIGFASEQERNEWHHHIVRLQKQIKT
ncbi:hypothetical protein B0A55_04271 [Friedmanniomyces simplex]|uniref:DH domain-containing protein n=1 Tax=Friedmanniomyces simplex TaxID=329884 RepID=A0A4U0XD38_9PEZI|nr:hypothetical protein B0A55_04271 [Friedmanniomyces simplex]